MASAKKFKTVIFDDEKELNMSHKKTAKKASLKVEKPQATVSVKEYVQILSDLKKQVQEAQLKATLSASRELIKLYWLIGKTISEKQGKSGWGASVIEQLVKDLQNAFPGIAGFSRSNIFRMKAFFLAYEKVAQAVPLLEDLPVFSIPWGHNILLLRKIKDEKTCLWYAQQAMENGWSRSMLEAWIDSNLYARDGKAPTNFNKTLPSPQSDMAQQVFKDPYIFDFLTLHQDYLEKDLEQGLVDHIQKFLLELGQGFAFLGRQVNLNVDDVDYYIDLLFYHTKLRCYLVIELKIREFAPRDAGQMSFYLSAVDDLLKHPDDNPTIGLLLCKGKGKLTVEYALRSSSSPIGVASYETKLIESLPKDLKSSLPSVAQIEAELEKQEALINVEKKKRMKVAPKKKSA